MKGVVNIGMIAIIVIAALALASFGGFLPRATQVNDPTCFPGDILQPEYIQLRCEVNSVQYTGVHNVPMIQEGFWPVVINYGNVYCPPPQVDASDESTCKVSVINSFEGSYEFYLQPGQSKRVEGFYADGHMILYYTKKQLVFDDIASGIFDKPVCDGCDLTCTGMYDNNYFSSLPAEQQIEMQVDDIIDYPARWKPYPLVGGVIEYKGQTVECVQQSLQEAVMYSLERYDSKSGCYWHRSTAVGQEQCCPGATQTVGGIACNEVTYTWDEGASQGCCEGGACTVTNCPGEGGYAWEVWNPGEPIQTFTCQSATGECIGTPVSYSVQCNPNTNEGCPATQDCEIVSLNPLTTRCTAEATEEKTCTEIGLECCVEGQVPDYVQLRSCVESGYPEHYVCVNGFCVEPLPINVCNYDGTCQQGEIPTCPDCKVPNIFDWILAFLKLWLIGSIISAILLVIVAILFPPLRLIMLHSPLFFFILIILLGALIGVTFSIPVASLAATLI